MVNKSKENFFPLKLFLINQISNKTKPANKKLEEGLHHLRMDKN